MSEPAPRRGPVRLPVTLAYLLLLLALAAIGTFNQAHYRRQALLIDRKAELQVELADLRARAATVAGPLAISEWAGARGMVPVPRGGPVREAAPQDPPVPPELPTGLELRTIWR